MKFEAISIRSAPETLVQEIVKRIEQGELKPGTSLPSQRQLAKMFNVGMGTVREAIKILDVMGHVEVIRGKGTFVSDSATKKEKPVSQIDNAFKAVSLADLMKAREIVECEAAFLAANDADAENIRRLNKITKDMEASFKDRQAFYDLDFEFHIAVAEASNNKALLEIVKMLVDRAHNHIGFMDDSLGVSMPFNVEKAVGTARKIAMHIEAGDGGRAREEMDRHLNIVNVELRKEFLGPKDKNGSG